MIVELGHFALALALLVALTQAAAPMAGAVRRNQGWMLLGRRAAFLLLGLVTLSFLALTQAYVVSDFSVLNVAQNSHAAKPLLYKISGVWGNHEGSMLLWAWMLAFWGALAAHKPPTPFLARVVSVQGMIASGFLFFILFTSNPFLRLDPPAPQGMDLNPVLQDPLLAIHPPLLYAGYVGFSVAFCFAIAALLERKAGADWAAALRPWVLAAWTALTAGIALGSAWAYYELGWGGFWFWDPVENASLMPWLAGTALLHSVSVLARRGALAGWTVFLAILAFSLSLLGTFLVRAGVLTSVHAFASDPLRGVFILVLLTLAAGGGFFLYALRAPDFARGPSFRPVSREGALLLNNAFLCAAAAAVFLGTLYPLFLSALGLGDISVGAPYYRAMLAPLLAPFALLMGAAPFAAWREGDMEKISGSLLVPFLLVGFFLLWGPFNALAMTGFCAAGWIALATLRHVHGATAGFRRWRSLPAPLYGMTLAHMGFAVLLAGVMGATQLASEKILWMQPGDRTEISGKEIVFLGVEEALGRNYNADRGIFSAAGRFLTPERRWYPVTQRTTSETALRPDGLGMLYVVLGEAGADGKWVVRLYHHPLMLLVFAGAGLMTCGGLASLPGRRRRAA